MDGLLVINKPQGITSRDVVNKIGKIYHTKKVGHTGTLDPLATGVLVVCINKATKLVELLQCDDKEYIATFKFGILTDTLDIEGEVLKEEKFSCTKEEMLKALSTLEGNYDQEVPIYSAVKVNGKKLYEYAREKKDVELPKHNVNIYALELLNMYNDGDNIMIDVRCHVSKGTYIRALGNDIAKVFGTNAIMTALHRTIQGKFKIEDALDIDDINENTKLIPLIKSLEDYYEVEVDEYLKNKIKNGSLLENRYDVDKVLFTYNKEVLAIYEKYENDSTKIKPYKMLI